ncbi:HN1_G0029620.mRNA.1.CDS.1 [Saccharomyces cerevisiae]|nr:HN1_G0029620.mRNA.1.CDS.1 [Saccharomyces cerevisiae]
MFRKRLVNKSSSDEKNQKKRQKINFSEEKLVTSDEEKGSSDLMSLAKSGNSRTLQLSHENEGKLQKKGEDLDKYTLTINDDSTKEDLLNFERKELAEKAKKRRPSDDNELVLNISGKNKRLAKQINQPTNIRTTVLMDFQPDVCKDYKQTGYCGYGDSCKFLHSRDDFKTGWKLNQEWNADKEGSKAVTLDLEKIPFKCTLCKEDYKSPVVTNCGHYFCGSCFAKDMKKGTKCFICHKETHGSAKVASDLQKMLNKRKS